MDKVTVEYLRKKLSAAIVDGLSLPEKIKVLQSASDDLFEEMSKSRTYRKD